MRNAKYRLPHRSYLRTCNNFHASIARQAFVEMLSILRKAKLKDKEMRILMLSVYLAAPPSVQELLLTPEAADSTMLARRRL